MAEPTRRLATDEDLTGPYAERWEVVSGELVEKAMPSFEHGESQGTLRELLGPYRSGRGGPGGWWFGVEVRILFDLHHVYLPDIAGWRRDRHPTKPTGRPVLEVPDWACEVLSDSTRRVDLGEKLPIYHARHVDHVWLVDPEARLVQVYRWGPDGYVLVQSAIAGAKLRAEPFDAVEIDVSELFGE